MHAKRAVYDDAGADPAAGEKTVELRRGRKRLRKTLSRRIVPRAGAACYAAHGRAHRTDRCADRGGGRSEARHRRSGDRLPRRPEQRQVSGMVLPAAVIEGHEVSRSSVPAMGARTYWYGTIHGTVGHLRRCCCCGCDPDLDAGGPPHVSATCAIFAAAATGIAMDHVPSPWHSGTVPRGRAAGGLVRKASRARSTSSMAKWVWGGHQRWQLDGAARRARAGASYHADAPSKTTCRANTFAATSMAGRPGARTWLRGRGYRQGPYLGTYWAGAGGETIRICQLLPRPLRVADRGGGGPDRWQRAARRASAERLADPAIAHRPGASNRRSISNSSGDIAGRARRPRS